MPTVELENIGPVAKLSLPIPEAGGIVVLLGRNGKGKTESLEAIEKLTSGRGSVSVKDGALRGTVSGFGAMLTVARSAIVRGELEVESLDGRLSIADLIQPPVKDPAAADAKRIKTLVSLSGAKPDPSLFHDLIGGKEAFEDLIPNPEADDLVSLAARIKRDFEAAARKAEGAAIKAEVTAQARREAAGEIDLSEAVDPDAAYTELQEATQEHTRLAEQQKAADGAGSRSVEATEKLRTSELAYDGPYVSAAEIALRNAQTAEDVAGDLVEELQNKLKTAQNAYIDTLTAKTQADRIATTAKRHFAAMAAWRETIEAEVPLPPDPERLPEAAQRLDHARATVTKLPDIQRAKQHQVEALAADEEAVSCKAHAQQLRDAARGTDDVLSEAVAKLGTPLRVEAGRLVLDTERGSTYFQTLSRGERSRHGLDIAVAVSGDRTVFVVPQEFWEGLDPQNRSEFAEQVREKRIIVLTAEASAGEEVTAVEFCRRCSECVDYSHHWLVDPQEDPALSEYACKHCSQRGRQCESCEGDGCKMCNGEGVLPAD